MLAPTADVFFSVSLKLGYIHIRSIDRPLRGGAGQERMVIVTLQPQVINLLFIFRIDR